jgi:asparaginyl-tRNA synthetase
MDLLVPRIGELIGGSQREERPDILEKRLEQAGLRKEDYWWYIDSRRYGSVFHSGYGMGFERLIMLITGISNIRDVLPFARTPGNIEF